MIKNTAGQTICFQLLSTTDGSIVTSGTPIVYILGDGGTQIVGTGTIVHEGNGVWSYEPTQANTNYAHIAFTMLLSGAFSQTVNVYTKAGDAYTAVNDLKDVSYSDVAAACADSLETYDAPTKAELDTGLAALDVPTITEINATVDTALADYGAVTTAAPTVSEIVSGVEAGAIGDATAANQATIIDHILEVKGASFTESTDSLESIRERGDAAWVTGASGSAPTASEIRAEMDDYSTKLSSILEDTGSTIPAQLSGLSIPSAAAIADAVLDDVLSDLADNDLNVGQVITLRKAARGLFNRFFREVYQTTSAQIVKNDSGGQVASMAISEVVGVSQSKGDAT